jgi:hypothetical protein
VEGQIGWEQRPWAPVAYRIIQVHYKHQTWTWDLIRQRFNGKETSGARPQGPVELFDPRRALRFWTFAVPGEGEVAGRPTIRVTARPDPPDPDLYTISMLNQFSWIGDAPRSRSTSRSPTTLFPSPTLASTRIRLFGTSASRISPPTIRFFHNVRPYIQLRDDRAGGHGLRDPRGRPDVQPVST